MEKNAEIRPGITPDTENKLDKSKLGDEKRAEQSHKSQIDKLDDDVTKRLSDAAR